MNAYRQQQLAIAAAIERGDYDHASDLLRQDVRTFAQPPPEQSGTTGHDTTLTRAQKCAIIVKKAIRRHVRRWKRKQEEKTMTIYGRAITNEDMRNIAEYMNDEIREELHGKLAPCSNEKFLQEYIKRDPEILEILRNEFDFSE